MLLLNLTPEFMPICVSTRMRSASAFKITISPGPVLESMGVLGPNLLTAHNVMLSDEDIAIMAEGM